MGVEETGLSNSFVISRFWRNSGSTRVPQYLRSLIWKIWAWRAWRLSGRWPDGGLSEGYGHDGPDVCLGDDRTEAYMWPRVWPRVWPTVWPREIEREIHQFCMRIRNSYMSGARTAYYTFTQIVRATTQYIFERSRDIAKYDVSWLKHSAWM